MLENRLISVNIRGAKVFYPKLGMGRFARAASAAKGIGLSLVLNCAGMKHQRVKGRQLLDQRPIQADAFAVAVGVVGCFLSLRLDFAFACRNFKGRRFAFLRQKIAALPFEPGVRVVQAHAKPRYLNIRYVHVSRTSRQAAQRRYLGAWG